MKKGLGKLKKLRGRGLEEWRVRGAQLLAASAGRYGLSSLVREPSDQEFFKLLDTSALKDGGGERLGAEKLLGHFRTRRAPHFFAAFAEQRQTINHLRGRFGAEGGLIERARRICEGRFSLLGHAGLSFGSPPDFHLEPVSGKRAPAGVHWSRVDELGSEMTGDKKITWELNRCQYFETLGRAYWLTGEEVYARTFASHLAAWMEQNPPGRGLNWVSSLEVAFRAISWLWALHFFRDAEALGPRLFLRSLKFLYLHARHLETYLSTYSSPNTHLTGEALGLFYLGTLLPELAQAARWRKTGERILTEEIQRHVRPDGVYFEQSTYYGRYTADFYTHLLVLSKANGGRLAPELSERLAALLDHLMYITRPDGTTPFFGDDDGGRLVMLDERGPNDFRATLSTGAVLFGRGDYKFVAGELAEETLWLLGPGGLESFDRLEAHEPGETSRAFPDGGYYLMRDGWTSESNYLLMDCGPHGWLNCGHAHADALSFDLAARGRSLLVDPGTYTYTGSAEQRDHFRSSLAHNTLAVDCESSSVPGGPFDWKHVARAVARRWTSRERFDYFEGTHDGYARLSSPVTHTRSVLFLKGDYWIMRDRVEAQGAHLYDLRFHFGTDADPSLERVDEGEAVRERSVDRAGLELFAFGDGVSAWRKEPGFVSSCYGSREEAAVLVFSTEAEGAQEFVTYLLPRGAGEREEVGVREVEATAGRAFELAVEAGGRDLLLLGEDGPGVETARAVAEGAWAWIRFESLEGSAEDDGRAMRELLLLGCRRLMMDGREVFEAAERLEFLFARRVGDALHVETSAEGEFTIASFGASLLFVNGRACAATEDAPARVFRSAFAARGASGHTLESVR
jgi:Heparinase II/III-like protein/Heparinase II/III N-terminus